MKTIGLLPLDSRPCNTIWLEQLSKLAGYKFLMYPRNKCGTLFKSANFLDQKAWLIENASKMDCLILSFDGLTSGGLVQTRVGNADIEQIQNNIDFLGDIKNKNPHLEIYVFDVLMRTTISATTMETARIWALVNEYSRLAGEVYFNAREEDKKKLEEIKKQIPKEIIDEYLLARKKKNIINKLAINLSKKGLIDYLIILQEDAVPNGIQKIEQFELTNLINKNDLNNKIKYYNGTDEGALVLFARAILKDNNLSPKIYLHLPFANALEKSMIFEDRPFIENLKLMFETINLKLSSLEEADFALSIYTEKDNIDFDFTVTNKVYPTFDEVYYNYIKELNNLVSKIDTCFIDLLFPNGGCSEILKDINYKGLASYSAWNTASNSSGSALAHIASVVVAKHKQLDYKELNEKFKKERIIDDCLFQYEARRFINKDLIANNINIYNLEENGKIVLEKIEVLLKKFSKEYFDVEFSVSLPWNRTFEAEILIKD